MVLLLPGKRKLSVGIDPGWVNLGLAVVEQSIVDPFKVYVHGTKTINPSLGDYKFIEDLPFTINSSLQGFTFDYEVSGAVIERYVPYSNVVSTETENITMLIGMIRARLHLPNPCSDGKMDILMIRAIDWKIKMVQILNKHCGFQNPHPKLDKKFSVTAANFITGNTYEYKDNHEADAICLAALPFLVEEGKRQDKRRAEVTARQLPPG